MKRSLPLVALLALVLAAGAGFAETCLSPYITIRSSASTSRRRPTGRRGPMTCC